MKYKLYQENDFAINFDSEERLWSIVSRKFDVLLNENRKMVSVLILLNRDPNIVFSTLEKNISNSGLDVKILESFPLTQIFLFCFKNQLNYWCSLCAGWLGFVRLNDELIKELVACINSKWLSQKTRVTVKKYLQDNAIL